MIVPMVMFVHSMISSLSRDAHTRSLDPHFWAFWAALGAQGLGLQSFLSSIVSLQTTTATVTVIQTPAWDS
jgi:hypothetical protein